MLNVVEVFAVYQSAGLLMKHMMLFRQRLGGAYPTQDKHPDIYQTQPDESTVCRMPNGITSSSTLTPALASPDTSIYSTNPNK